MQFNVKLVALVSVLALSACVVRTAPPQQQLGPDGQPIPVAYTITEADAQQIPGRILQQVNQLRANVGQTPLTLSPQLSAAAVAHSRDMSAQNRAWHWGSDGSSPNERGRRQGYYGTVRGENISESYENDIATLTAWMTDRDTRDVIMDPSVRDLGFGWYQEPSKKVWWTLLTGE